MARIVGIAIRDTKRAPMKELSSVVITQENGLEGDFRGGGGILGDRQVTLLSLQQWIQACVELRLILPWHARRANICVDGIDFGPKDLGRKISVGAVTLEITGETKPCKRMDEIQKDLKAALTPDWRGGVTCRVIAGGAIIISDSVEFIF